MYWFVSFRINELNVAESQFFSVVLENIHPFDYINGLQRRRRGPVTLLSFQAITLADYNKGTSLKMGKDDL
jgi:hypothetical protein